ncbi:MAG: 3-ketoacyl-CoA thiolase, partial [uncultured Gemmatimonadaceae bacterium]
AIVRKRPPGRDRARDPHPLRQGRDGVQVALGDRPREVRRGRAAAARGDRPAHRRGARLRHRRALGGLAEHRARGLADADAPQGRRGVHGEPRLRVRQPGDHRRRRPDRARPLRRRDRGRGREPLERADPARARVRRGARRGEQGEVAPGQGAGVRADPPQGPRPDRAGHRRAHHRGDDGAERGEDGEGEPRAARRAGPARAALAPPRRRGHRGRPPHERDRPGVRGARLRDRGHERQRHPREHEPRGARRAQAGVRQALRHGDGRQLEPAHRRRRGDPAHERGAGARRGVPPARLHPQLRVRRARPGRAAADGPRARRAGRAQARGPRARRRRPRGDARGVRRAGAGQPRRLREPRVGRARGVRRAGGRGGPLAAQRDGRLARDRPPVRRHRRAHPHDAVPRAAPPRRGVRADDRVRGRRDGARDGGGASM